MYASLGYDFLAETDHNMALDARKWSKWQDRANLILIPGEENGTTDHIVEIGVHQVTYTPDEKYADLNKWGILTSNLVQLQKRQSFVMRTVFT